MSKQITIFLAQVVGAVIFATLMAVITFLYVKYCNLSYGGGGDFINIGLNPGFHVMVAQIVGAWIGMLIGGIAGFQIAAEKLGGQTASAIVGLLGGLIAFVILNQTHQLHNDVSYIFVFGTLLLCLAAGFSCAMVSFYFAGYISSVKSPRGIEPVLFIAGLILSVSPPLLMLLVKPSAIKEARQVWESLEMNLLSAIYTFPPLLLLWVILLACLYLSAGKKLAG